MVLVVGCYEIAVAPGAWICGPTILPGETVRVQAGGFVRWGGLPAGPPTPHAYHWGDVVKGAPGTALWSGPNMGYGAGYILLPAGQTSQTITSTAGNVVVEGSALPGGATVVGVRLEITPTVESGASGDVSAILSLTVGGSVVGTQTFPLAAGASTVALGSSSALFARTWTSADLGSIDWTLQLVNRASASRGVGVQDVRVTLYAAGTPATAGSLYAYPEGTYPPDYGPVGYGESYTEHYPPSYDPSVVLQPGDWTGDPLLAPGLPPLALAMVAWPDGPAPPFVATATALAPGRDSTYDADALGAGDAAKEGLSGLLRLWFAVNDALSSTSDARSYSLLVERTLTVMSNTIARTSLTAPRFGTQTANKTRAAAAYQLACLQSLDMKPEQTTSPITMAGVGHTVGSKTSGQASTGEAKITLDYVDSFQVVRDAIAGVYNAQQIANGVWQHTVVATAFRQNPPARKTVEFVGEPTDPVSMVLDFVFNGLKIQCDPSKLATCSSSALGGKIDYGTKAAPIVPTVGRNDVQVVAFVGNPTGGKALLLDENLPVVISPTQTASDLQAAIRTIPGRSADLVSGSVGGPYTITNTTGNARSLLVADWTDLNFQPTLTGGVSPSMTVAWATVGGFNIGTVELVASADSWSLVLGDSWPAILNQDGTLTLDGNWSSDITLAERMKREWIQKGAGVFNYGLKAPGELTDSVKLSMALDAQSRGYLIDAQNDARKCLRLQSVGDVIPGTTANYGIQIDLDGQLTWDGDTDVANAKSIDLTMTAHYNQASGCMLRITYINGTPPTYYV